MNVNIENNFQRFVFIKIFVKFDNFNKNYFS